MSANIVNVAIGAMIAIQGALMIASDDPIGAIPMAAILGFGWHRLIAGWLMIVVLPVSVVALSSRKVFSPLVRFGCVVPQLIVILVFAWGAITAVLHGHYADGITRPQSFILADQLSIIILMILYCVAVAEIVGKRGYLD